MKTLGIYTLGAVVALSFGIAATVHAPDAMAQGKGGPAKTAAPKAKPKDDKKPATAAEAPATKKPVTIQPTELAWGIDKKKLAGIYDKVIDQDYNGRYKKAQPGPEMDRLDAEVTEKKSEFRRSEIQFGTVPTGVDGTSLRPEYTYNNKEFLLSIDRGGKTRYFFFIGDKMWKVIDALKLGEKSQWGKSFDDAVKILNNYYGTEGRSRPADDAAGRPYKEVDWKDGNNQVRAVDWGNDQFGLVFQDASTVSNLASLRKNKDTNAKEVDARVKDAGMKRAPEAPPPKTPPATKKK
jgi:hypothetical protein